MSVTLKHRWVDILSLDDHVWIQTNPIPVAEVKETTARRGRREIMLEETVSDLYDYHPHRWRRRKVLWYGHQSLGGHRWVHCRASNFT